MMPPFLRFTTASLLKTARIQPGSSDSAWMLGRTRGRVYS
jgi:hypothetical protein